MSADVASACIAAIALIVSIVAIVISKRASDTANGLQARLVGIEAARDHEVNGVR